MHPVEGRQCHSLLHYGTVIIFVLEDDVLSGNGLHSVILLNLGANQVTKLKNACAVMTT